MTNVVFVTHVGFSLAAVVGHITGSELPGLDRLLLWKSLFLCTYGITGTYMIKPTI